MSLTAQYRDEVTTMRCSATIDPRGCLCRGSGWMLSDFDTWHECPRHYVHQPHPEDDYAPVEASFVGCWDPVMGRPVPPLEADLFWPALFAAWKAAGTWYEGDIAYFAWRHGRRGDDIENVIERIRDWESG